ncbi:MAG TPA: transcriptional regulator, partial [Rhodanobacteraceae bacterium]
MATYRFGDFTLTASTRELKHGETPVAISPRAFDCLAYLLEHRDRAVGKDELVAAIWERIDVSDTQLGQTVLRARRAVNDDGQAQNVIRTVSRFGYRWVADVTLVDDTTSLPASTLASASPAASDPPPSQRTAPLRASERNEPGKFLPIVFAATLVLVALVATVFGWRALRHATPPTPHEAAGAVVLPMRVATADSEAWLRLGVMDLVAERMRAGGLQVPPSETTVALLQNVDDADDAATQAIRRVAPASLIVDGAITRAGESWKVALRAVASDGTALTAESSQRDALDAARDATDRLLGRLGRAEPPNPPYANGVQQRLQRAQAAMLSNDLDAARAILVSDPDLAQSEPELTYRLAMVDFRAGAYARAEGALTSLLGESAAADPLFRARVL